MKSLLLLLILHMLNGQQLLYVVEVFRHGAREPIYYNNDFTPDMEAGELTGIGMRQHY